MEVSGQLHAPAALLPEESPLIPIGYEAGWASEMVWTQWCGEKFPAPVGTRIKHGWNLVNEYPEEYKQKF